MRGRGWVGHGEGRGGGGALPLGLIMRIQIDIVSQLCVFESPSIALCERT